MAFIGGIAKGTQGGIGAHEGGEDETSLLGQEELQHGVHGAAGITVEGAIRVEQPSARMTSK